MLYVTNGLKQSVKYMNIDFKTYCYYLSKDRSRYSVMSHLKLYFSNTGYKLTTHYRRCSFLRSKKYLFFLYMIERFFYHSMCVKYGCDIPSHVIIGPGLKIDHPVGIVINSTAIIGANFTIKTGSVIGKKDDNGAAHIGDNVQIGAHALIIGNITIGDNVDVGAGAIVTHNVPDCAVVRCQAAAITRFKDIK